MTISKPSFGSIIETSFRSFFQLCRVAIVCRLISCTEYGSKCRTVYSTYASLKTFHVVRTCCIVFDFLCAVFRLLKRVSDLIILPDPYLLLLLVHYMFHPDLLCFLLHERSNVSRIPQLTGNTKIFTAAHQCIRFATLGCGGYPFGGEVILFASCNRNQPTNAKKSASDVPLDRV